MQSYKKLMDTFKINKDNWLEYETSDIIDYIQSCESDDIEIDTKKVIEMVRESYIRDQFTKYIINSIYYDLYTYFDEYGDSALAFDHSNDNDLESVKDTFIEFLYIHKGGNDNEL